MTVAENNLRGDGCMAAYARKTHCPHGHACDEKNTQIQKSAWRYRTCISRETVFTGRSRMPRRLKVSVSPSFNERESELRSTAATGPSAYPNQP